MIPLLKLLLRKPLPTLTDQVKDQHDRHHKQHHHRAADQLNISVLVKIPFVFTDDQIPAEAGGRGKEVFMVKPGLDARGRKALAGFYKRKDAGIFGQGECKSPPDQLLVCASGDNTVARDDQRVAGAAFIHLFDMRLDQIHRVVHTQNGVLIAQEDRDRKTDIPGHRVHIRGGYIGVIAHGTLIPVAVCGNIVIGHIEIRDDDPAGPGHIYVEAAVDLLQNLRLMGIDEAPQFLLIAQKGMRGNREAHGKLLRVVDGGLQRR